MESTISTMDIPVISMILYNSIVTKSFFFLIKIPTVIIVQDKESSTW